MEDFNPAAYVWPKPEPWYFTLLNFSGLIVSLIAVLEITLTPNKSFNLSSSLATTALAMYLPMAAVWAISILIEWVQKRRGSGVAAHNEVPVLFFAAQLVIVLPAAVFVFGLLLAFFVRH